MCVCVYVYVNEKNVYVNEKSVSLNCTKTPVTKY